jgi:hypothetical protein
MIKLRRDSVKENNNTQNTKGLKTELHETYI